MEEEEHIEEWWEGKIIEEEQKGNMYKKNQEGGKEDVIRLEGTLETFIDV